MDSFCHLHCHTQYSLLDGAAQIKQLMTAASQHNMRALAITDHGNMFGVPHFVAAAQQAQIKPIVGCEFYIAPDMHDRQDRRRYHQILLAKNEVGYKNLSKLCSLGFLEGYYYKPRVDQKTIAQYSQGLIATTCCLASQVCQTILQQGEQEAERCFLGWLEIFGADYYIELQRHGLRAQDQCNAVLTRWSAKHGVKIIATNDVHYVERSDSTAQDILLCLQTGKDYDDPNRIRFENDQFFLKSPAQMLEAFSDLPEAVANTEEVAAKVEPISLDRDVLLPLFRLPKGFSSQDEYLKHLVFAGAQRRYGTLTDEIRARLDYELSVVQKMGFAGYFLIVQDFIQAARALDVVVGPGRGSVVGSAVSYCIGISDVDPLHYNLLFERFLNPERVSMPDIDIDFDDEGRQKVIDYVVDKYGKNQVAQIITFGSMGAKSAIRDVARVIGLPLEKANVMAKLVPEKPGTTLEQAFSEVPELAALQSNPESMEGRVLAFAKTLEGSARHTGIHAAGIIIAPDDLLEFIPVKSDKNSNLFVTQYDGSVIERLGMLKMDFLSLKTLSIIKDALLLIQKRGQAVALDQVSLCDEKTFALYQRGDTVATFQFESEGMRQWLKQLQPSSIEDLIAMNALYRPGPMQFIPQFIARKQGKEKTTYAHPLLEEVLQNTYGLMVYQEQIIQAAQLLAGYSLGAADLLRRAMGKKKAEEMAQQRDVFVRGARQKHNIPKSTAVEIFSTMEKFAQYGFNRSHAAAYTILAYHTAYLKAHHPAEYMASVLTHNQGDISKISFFMEACKRQGISVLGPDINESEANFSVNEKGQIRFGLSAIKGAGAAAVESLIAARKERGAFENLFAITERVALRAVTKKTLECFVKAGALDSFSYHRRQYLNDADPGGSLIEKAIKYGQQRRVRLQSAQQSLFGVSDSPSATILPAVQACTPYPEAEQLRMEKETVGFYLSGHPLDSYRIDIKSFCNGNTQNALHKMRKQLSLAGAVTACKRRQTKHGKPFALLTIEDFEGTLDVALFGEPFLKHQHLLQEGVLLYLLGHVEARYGQSDVLEYRPYQIHLLSEIRQKLTRSVCLEMSADRISDTTIEELVRIVKQYTGTYPLQVLLRDPANAAAFTLRSRQYKVKPSSDLLKAIEGLQEVVCSLQA